jgi:hypothetical protein
VVLYSVALECASSYLLTRSMWSLPTPC